MSDILDLEQQIKNAEEIVERRQMAIKLAKNREFRVLFMEGYWVKDAARLVQMSTDFRVTQPEIRASALEEAKATGYMKRFLSDCIQMGAHFERELPAMREALARMQTEGDAYYDSESDAE